MPDPNGPTEPVEYDGPTEPYVEYEITVRVFAPKTDPEPKDWLWGEITDMGDNIEFHSQRIVAEHQRPTDPDDWSALSPVERAYWLAGMQRTDNDNA